MYFIFLYKIYIYKYDTCGACHAHGSQTNPGCLIVAAQQHPMPSKQAILKFALPAAWLGKSRRVDWRLQILECELLASCRARQVKTSGQTTENPENFGPKYRLLAAGLSKLMSARRSKSIGNWARQVSANGPFEMTWRQESMNQIGTPQAQELFGQFDLLYVICHIQYTR